MHVNATFAYPILTVDSCTPWDWDGNEEDVDKYPTSSQSGLIDFSGWLTDVPNYGRQYFYHDLDIDFREDALKEDDEINQKLLKRKDLAAFSLA